MIWTLQKRLLIKPVLPFRRCCAGESTWTKKGSGGEIQKFPDKTIRSEPGFLYTYSAWVCVTPVRNLKGFPIDITVTLQLLLNYQSKSCQILPYCTILVVSVDMLKAVLSVAEFSSKKSVVPGHLFWVLRPRKIVLRSLFLGYTRPPYEPALPLNYWCWWATGA